LPVSQSISLLVEMLRQNTTALPERLSHSTFSGTYAGCKNRPRARWRVKPVTAHQRHSKRLQLVLSIVTLILLAGEWFTHPLIHRTG
jgi:hypothetical protein